MVRIGLGNLYHSWLDRLPFEITTEIVTSMQCYMNCVDDLMNDVRDQAAWAIQCAAALNISQIRRRWERDDSRIYSDVELTHMLRSSLIWVRAKEDLIMRCDPPSSYITFDLT